MKIFRFMLQADGIDDAWYFLNPPTKDDILKAIESHREIADENWGYLYDNFKAMVEKLEPEDFTGAPKVEGGKCGIGGPLVSGIYSFDRYEVIDNMNDMEYYKRLDAACDKRRLGKGKE